MQNIQQRQNKDNSCQTVKTCDNNNRPSIWWRTQWKTIWLTEQSVHHCSWRAVQTDHLFSQLQKLCLLHYSERTMNMSKFLFRILLHVWQTNDMLLVPGCGWNKTQAIGYVRTCPRLLTWSCGFVPITLKLFSKTWITPFIWLEATFTELN